MHCSTCHGALSWFLRRRKEEETFPRGSESCEGCQSDSANILVRAGRDSDSFHPSPGVTCPAVHFITTPNMVVVSRYYVMEASPRRKKLNAATTLHPARPPARPPPARSSRQPYIHHHTLGYISVAPASPRREFTCHGSTYLYIGAARNRYRHFIRGILARLPLPRLRHSASTGLLALSGSWCRVPCLAAPEVPTWEPCVSDPPPLSGVKLTGRLVIL